MATDASPNPDAPVPAGDAPGARAFAWGCLALMLIGGFRYVALYGSNVPFWDEWTYVPIWTGELPATFDFFWAFHNEHRVPLPKLILLGLARLTGCDFRAGLYCNVALLGILAGAMIRAARKLRGGTSYADAFFPLALLHWGHYATFWSGFQIQYVLSTLFATALLLVMARNPRRLGPGMIALAGACLVGLTLTGAQGLVLVPALGLWLAVAALGWGSGPRPSGEGAWRGRIAAAVGIGSVAAAAALVLLYARDYRRMSRPPQSPDLLATLRTASEFASATYGEVARQFWPATGGMLLALVVLTVARLGYVWWRRPEERGRVQGLVLFLGAMASACLGLGYGRSVLGPGSGFESRYAVMAAPLLCALYFAWLLYGRPAARQGVPMALFASMCVALLPNAKASVELSELVRGEVLSFERDLRGGMSLSALIDRYSGHCPLLPPPQDHSAERMLILHRAGVGVFKRLRLDNECITIPLPHAKIGHNDMAWDGDVGRTTGPAPFAVYDLGSRKGARAVRVTCMVEGSSPRAPLKFYWGDRSRNEFTDAERNTVVDVETGRPVTLTVEVNDTIDMFRIDLKEPVTTLRVDEIAIVLAAPRPRVAASAPSAPGPDRRRR